MKSLPDAIANVESQTISKRKRLARHWAVRIVFLVSLPFLLVCSVFAIPASEYHKHVQQAVTALDTLVQSDETESTTAFGERDAETIQAVRGLLPATETVEWDGEQITVDTNWLHQDLDKYAAEKSASRYELLKRITERLKAIDERITEIEKPAEAQGSKEERKQKLAEILQRPEYARKAKTANAFNRLSRTRFLSGSEVGFPNPNRCRSVILASSVELRRRW